MPRGQQDITPSLIAIGSLSLRRWKVVIFFTLMIIYKTLSSLYRIMSRRLTKRYLTPADEYKCPLSEETQAIAEAELRETDSTRCQALEALRKWMEQNPKFLAVRMGT